MAIGEIISKKESDKLMGLEGEVRGIGMKNYATFIFEREGEEGLKRLEKVMAKLGHPIKYREMRAMEFFPIGLEAATLIAIKKLFNYDDKQFQEMGRFGTRLSFVFRLFTKYLVSPEKIAKEAPKMWRKGSSVGDLKIVEYSEEKRQLTLRLENYDLHPIHCQVAKGYFSSGAEIALGHQATCEETKCLYRGDEYHEFLLKW